MAGGIEITQSDALALAEAVALATVTIGLGAGNIDQALNDVGITVPTFGPYRDKQQNKPAVYSISVPATYSNQSLVTNSVTGTQIGSDGVLHTGVAEHQNAPTLFVFDAVFVANHSKTWTPTKKPIQSGYNTTDHIIKNQPTVTLEIGMSDAMAAYAPGMWTGNPSKSISCWQQLNTLADSRVLFTLATRQETYQNMAIVGIESPEDNKTTKSLKARITFSQMLLVAVTSQILSARPNATDETQLATLQGQIPSTTTIQQHEVTPEDLPTGSSESELNNYDIPAGGEFSSNLVTQ